SLAANIPLVSELAIDDIHFDDFSLDVDAMITAALRMFMELGMVQKFKIDYETLCRWLLTVRKNYRMVLYHNWRHAFNVCQLMFAMLTDKLLREEIISCSFNNIYVFGQPPCVEGCTSTFHSVMYLPIVSGNVETHSCVSLLSKFWHHIKQDKQIFMMLVNCLICRFVFYDASRILQCQEIKTIYQAALNHSQEIGAASVTQVSQSREKCLTGVVGQ
ncbi:hypothetical protein P7K49_013924, partial [Saguinus oedipus]